MLFSSLRKHLLILKWPSQRTTARAFSLFSAQLSGHGWMGGVQEKKDKSSVRFPEKKVLPLLLPNGNVRRMSSSISEKVAMRMKRRMKEEGGKTLREIRRAKKLRKKLMTEEERLIFNLRRAKKKVALLLQRLKKYELPELPPPKHDPELLTPEQLQNLRKIGFKNKNYVPVGVRGVFGGVVQNMHLHWKFHETVQVWCGNFPKEKIKEMAIMLARLSGGIVINIHNVKTVIMYRGRNYRQPKNLIPVNTLTKRKALFKARFEQALEAQKINIKKIEQQLRRMGVNPEDPVAMASVQKVASTFFRAIDDRQGSPYVFDGNEDPDSNRKGTSSGLDDVKDSSYKNDELEDQPLSEDSDQEELDRFIDEIERAADEEWKAEEAAEREEEGKLRYWNREDYKERWGSEGKFVRSAEDRTNNEWDTEDENSEGREVENDVYEDSDVDGEYISGRGEDRIHTLTPTGSDEAQTSIGDGNDEYWGSEADITDDEHDREDNAHLKGSMRKGRMFDYVSGEE